MMPVSASLAEEITLPAGINNLSCGDFVNYLKENDPNHEHRKYISSIITQIRDELYNYDSIWVFYGHNSYVKSVPNTFDLAMKIIGFCQGDKLSTVHREVDVAFVTFAQIGWVPSDSDPDPVVSK